MYADLGDCCCKRCFAMIYVTYRPDVQVLLGSGVDVISRCCKTPPPACSRQSILTLCTEPAMNASCGSVAVLAPERSRGDMHRVAKSSNTLTTAQRLRMGFDDARKHLCVTMRPPRHLPPFYRKQQPCLLRSAVTVLATLLAKVQFLYTKRHLIDNFVSSMLCTYGSFHLRIKYSFAHRTCFASEPQPCLEQLHPYSQTSQPM